MKDKRQYVLLSLLGFPIAANYTASDVSFQVHALGPSGVAFYWGETGLPGIKIKSEACSLR